MSTLEIFKAIQSSGLGRYLSGQNHLFGAFYQLLHIIGLIMVLSSIILLSLRIWGGGIRSQSLQEITRATSWLIRAGLGLLAFSGILVFIPAATNYYYNTAFWIKFALLAVALLLHQFLYRRASQQQYFQVAILTRLAAAFSLLLWLSVAFAGRFIGFI
jgi:hypothetical protein